MKFKPLLLLLLLICTSAVFAVPASFIYRNVEAVIVEELGKNAIGIAATVSKFAELNIDHFQNIPINSFEAFGGEAGLPDNPDSLFTGQDGGMPTDASTSDNPAQAGETVPGSASDPFQDNLKDVFIELMDATGAQAIYIERKLSDETKAYLIHEGYPNKSRYYGSSKLTEDELLAFNEGISVPSSIMQDDTIGQYIAGYAPIKHPANENVVGIVVVEFALSRTEKISGGIRSILYLSFGVIIALTTLVVFQLLKSRQKYFKKDYLTELCNKSYFEKRLKMLVRLSRDMHKPLVLIMIDIDHFKLINDTYGHPVGDQVLKSVSETIRAQTRDCDLCARYGGDEFAVLLTNSDLVQAAAVAERIRQKTAMFDHLHGYPVKRANGCPAGSVRLSVTLSIGVTRLQGGMTPEDFLKAADLALYNAKNTGKNKVCVYPSGMPMQNAPCLQQG